MIAVQGDHMTNEPTSEPMAVATPPGKRRLVLAPDEAVSQTVKRWRRTHLVRLRMAAAREHATVEAVLDEVLAIGLDAYEAGRG